MSVHKEPAWPPFNPFVRHPTSLLGKIKMVCGSILVPFRVAGALTTLSAGLVWCNICSLGCDTSRPYSPLRQLLLVGGLRVLSRTLLFFYGFVWIHESYEIEDPKERAKQPPPSLVVVNHIGFAELLYLVWSDGCCFVSKHDNRKLPFIGRISEVLQTIYVDRGEGISDSSTHSTDSSSSDTRANTTEQILERAHSPPGTWQPLACCPEGTTHTGHCMIRFQSGAFRPGLPVQPVIVSSPFSPIHGYDTSFSCTNIGLHVLGLMTQPWNSFHVKHLAVYVPNDAEKADPVLYAKNVRSKMAKELGVECYDLTWTHKLLFEVSERAQELGRRKLAARNGGVVPPMPVFTQDPFGNSLESAKDK